MTLSKNRVRRLFSNKNKTFLFMRFKRIFTNLINFQTPIPENGRKKWIVSLTKFTNSDIL